MSTVRTTNLQNPSSAINNLVLNANGTVTVTSGILFADGNLLSQFATSSDIAGLTIPSGTITSGTSQLSLSGTTNQSSVVSGAFVTGQGILPGTTVISGAGTYVVGLSQNANTTISDEPIVFYKPNAIVTPGAIGGQLCRAWVNFDGTTSPINIRASFNVSSITDNGTGDYTVNFTTAMPDANYCAVTAYNEHETQGAYNSSLQVSSLTYTASAVRVKAWYGSGGASDDASICNVAIFR